METHHEVCVSLDRLCVEMLGLMEEKLENLINVEHYMKISNVELAKSRYILGQSKISQIQLPTSNTPEFSALSTVDKKADDEPYELNVEKCEQDGPKVNPMKWFGVLLPQNMHRAQQFYKTALDYAVRAVNSEERLKATCDAISELKNKKNKLTPEE